jgi:hypothetical protein
MSEARKLLAAIRKVEEADDPERAVAAARRQIEKHPQLVNATAPPEFPYPPLGEAIVAYAPDLVRLLLERGADPNARLSDPDDVFATGLRDSGQRPLHLAAAYREGESVEALLEHGADPNARDNQGWPPLFYAGLVWTGTRGAPTDVVDALIDAGADLHATDHAGRSIIETRGEDADLMEFLADEYAIPLPLYAALCLGRVARARQVLADPNYRLPDDRLARGGLLWATMQLYRYSLFGPDEPFAGGGPLTAADVEYCRAKVRDHLDILKSLLDRGILAGDRGHPGGTVMDTQDPHPGEPSIGYRALTEAVQLISPDPAEMLLRAGVRPGSDVQFRELLNMTGFGPRRMDMLDALARYGITDPRG